MKLLIASDLHGSAPHCRALLDAFRREGADKLLLLGDLLHRDFKWELPGDVIDMLNGMADKILAVRGNCDEAGHQRVLHFPMLADYALLHVDGRTLYAAHGHAVGPYDPPPLQRGDCLLCGHTHVPACRRMEDYTYLNPGSTSLPKGGSQPSYLLLAEGDFSWHELFSGAKFRP